MFSYLCRLTKSAVVLPKPTVAITESYLKIKKSCRKIIVSNG